MSEEEYADKYPVLYHELSLSEVNMTNIILKCMKKTGKMVISNTDNEESVK